MKKIGRFIYRVLSFLDKYIIVPITKLMIFVSNFFKDNSRNIERFVNNKQTLVVISLVFAIIVFFIVDRNSNSIINNSAEMLYNQPIVADYNEESYVIEGLPEKVDVTLVGTKAYLYLAKQYSSNLKISADLTDLTPGKHKVSLKISQGLESIDYKVNPSTVTVVVYEKVSATKELTYDLLHKDNLDTKLNISNIDLSRNDCIIKGPDYKLKQVATVKSLIDIDNLSNPREGKITMKDIPLVAYDASGNIVDVEIVPKTVEASIEIKSPKKENVPIKVVPKGKIAFGKSIKSIDMSLSTITIYGDQDSLNDIEYVPVEVDVKDLKHDKVFNLDIPKPPGVREMSSKTMTVKIKLDDEVTKEFKNITITPVNPDPKYKYNAASKDDLITVIVKGSKSSLEELTRDSIMATVDVAGLGEGIHEVDVKVTGEDLRVNYQSKTKKIKVKITKAS